MCTFLAGEKHQSSVCSVHRTFSLKQIHFFCGAVTARCHQRTLRQSVASPFHRPAASSKQHKGARERFPADTDTTHLQRHVHKLIGGLRNEANNWQTIGCSCHRDNFCCMLSAGFMCAEPVCDILCLPPFDEQRATQQEPTNPLRTEAIAAILIFDNRRSSANDIGIQ